jgi:hypothetical protein
MEHQACCEQSRTERNTGIDGTRPDPAASCWSFTDNHGRGPLTALLSSDDPLNAALQIVFEING